MVVSTGHFEAAHMLSKYDGKCKNLHGHSYKYEVVVDGGLNNDMIIDFNYIKDVCEGYDHAIIFASPQFQSEAEKELLTWAFDNGMRYAVMQNGRPTAENIAKQIADEVYALAGKTCDINSVGVKLWETDNNYATARTGDNVY